MCLSSGGKSAKHTDLSKGTATVVIKLLNKVIWWTTWVITLQMTFYMFTIKPVFHNINSLDLVSLSASLLPLVDVVEMDLVKKLVANYS